MSLKRSMLKTLAMLAMESTMTADKNIYSNQRLSNEGMRFNPDYRRPSTSRDMKQTVEVAIEYAGSVISSFGTNGVPNGISAIKEMIASGFKSGAEWRSKQSPWIKISDGLPDVDDYYLVTDGESISMAYFFKGWSKFAKYHKYPHPFYDDGVVKLYMPIPPISLALEGDRGILNIGEFKRKEIDYEQK